MALAGQEVGFAQGDTSTGTHATVTSGVPAGDVALGHAHVPS
jgi:hypothetical protein